MPQKKLRVITLCVFGMGTALLLKMLVEKAFKELGLDAEVITTNLTSVAGLVASGQVDLIAAQADLENELSKFNVPLVLVKNFTDVEEVKRQIKEALKIS